MIHSIRRRQWVRDTGNGFILIDRTGEREIHDDEVLSMAVISNKNHGKAPSNR